MSEVVKWKHCGNVVSSTQYECPICFGRPHRKCGNAATIDNRPDDDPGISLSLSLSKRTTPMEWSFGWGSRESQAFNPHFARRLEALTSYRTCPLFSCCFCVCFCCSCFCFHCCCLSNHFFLSCSDSFS